MSRECGSEHDAWHTLFDALCNDRGWNDNNHPASELCVRLGRNTRQDFEAAKKKLRAWRSGRRLPLRRNLAMLSALLEIGHDPELERRWITLYRRAAMPGGSEAAEVAAPAMGRGSRAIGGWVMAGLALLLGSGVVYAAISGGKNTALAALPQVSFEGYVRVPVGASHLVHGALETCKSEPPAWNDVVDTLPETPYGTLSDGGIARKVVRRCGAERPVRGIMFTGVAPGTAELRLFGDYLKIDVITTQPEPAEGKLNGV